MLLNIEIAARLLLLPLICIEEINKLRFHFRLWFQQFRLDCWHVLGKFCWIYFFPLFAIVWMFGSESLHCVCLFEIWGVALRVTNLNLLRNLLEIMRFLFIVTVRAMWNVAFLTCLEIMLNFLILFPCYCSPGCLYRCLLFCLTNLMSLNSNIECRFQNCLNTCILATLSDFRMSFFLCVECSVWFSWVHLFLQITQNLFSLSIEFVYFDLFSSFHLCDFSDLLL